MGLGGNSLQHSRFLYRILKFVAVIPDTEVSDYHHPSSPSHPEWAIHDAKRPGVDEGIGENFGWVERLVLCGKGSCAGRHSRTSIRAVLGECQAVCAVPSNRPSADRISPWLRRTLGSLLLPGP